MLQPSQSQFSEEDYNLIEGTHLGNPLYVYRPKSGYLIFLRAFGIFCQILVCVLFIEAMNNIYLIILNHNDISSFILVGIGALFAILGVECFVLILLPNERKQHLIICEEGLIQVKKKLWGEQVAVVYWEEILDIKRGGTFLEEYHIIQRGKKEVVPLFTGYQHFGELVAWIRARIAKAETS